MAEWSKARDSKSRIRQRIQGSNPCLSAKCKTPRMRRFAFGGEIGYFEKPAWVRLRGVQWTPRGRTPEGRAVPRSGMAGSP